MNFSRSSLSLVQALAPKPNGLAFATRIASSAFFTRDKDATGPNNSPQAVGEPLEMFARRVGRQWLPGWFRRFKPVSSPTAARFVLAISVVITRAGFSSSASRIAAAFTVMAARRGNVVLRKRLDAHTAR